MLFRRDLGESGVLDLAHRNLQNSRQIEIERLRESESSIVVHFVLWRATCAGFAGSPHSSTSLLMGKVILSYK